MMKGKGQLLSFSSFMTVASNPTRTVLNMNESIVADPNAMLQVAREEGKKRFHVERQEILSKVPSHVQCLFHQIGFIDEKPALALSPFSVPPGPLRAAWINKFLEWNHQNRVDELPLLVYYYGSGSNYSIVSVRQWISFEQGRSRGLDCPPSHVQDKLVLGQALTNQEEQALLPWREMKLDCRKSPHERHRKDFVECYNLLTLKQGSPATMTCRDRLDMGTCVAIYWDGDDQWYNATIIDIRHEFYHVEYDDAYREWLPLAERRYKLLNSAPNNAPRRVSFEQQQQDPKQAKRCGLIPKKELSPIPKAAYSRPPSPCLDGKIEDAGEAFSVQISPDTERLSSPLTKKRKFKEEKVPINGSIVLREPKKPFGQEHRKVSGDGRIILQGAKDDAKKEFEKLRTETLAAIPEKIKSMFGQVGFTKWGKTSLPFPCLVLSPFDVPPGQVRDTWFAMFERMKKFDTLNKMTYLIYWYGAKEIDSYYGFIPQNHFTKYETGVKKKLHMIPTRIQKKLDANKKLPKADQDLVDGIRDMQEDLEKEAADRKRGIIDFPEGYEMLAEADVAYLLMGGSEEKIETDYDSEASEVYI